jgi:tyrosyl-tRNA synthetase
MLEREDFSKRFKENMPITIMEFLYPLAQAYDSVAISADVELGGLDQKFNLLIGRDIQREYGQEPQVIITVPLLIGVDGKWAMSQSRGNYIGITEPPYEMYGKVMSIPDEIVKQYFELLTEVPWDEVKAFHPKDCKARLAWEIVRFFHGGKKADEAKEEFERVFSRGERPSEVERVFINPGLIKKDGTIWIVDLLSGSSSVKSRSEAKRLIEQGAVWVSGKRIKSVDCDLPFEEGMLLRVGKRRFVEVFIEKG